jgi:hypothetical protein
MTAVFYITANFNRGRQRWVLVARKRNLSHELNSTFCQIFASGRLHDTIQSFSTRGCEMRNKETLLEELDWLADKISSQVWTLNLGTLATTWSLLIAAGSVEKLRIGSANAIPIMGLCILAMLSDLIQYLAGYANARFILGDLENSGRTEFEYYKSGWFYILRETCFYGKIALTLAAATWLLVVLAGKFI